jgi:hypothetical protein
MNYLTGPLTRVQLPALNQLAGAELSTPSSASPSQSQKSARPTAGGESLTSTRPNVPAGIDEFFLPNNLSFLKAVDQAGLSAPQDTEYQVVYKPALLGQATVRFMKRNYNLDYDLVTAALVREPDQTGRVRWDDWVADPVDHNELEPAARGEAQFHDLISPLSDGSKLRELETDFKDWIYHSVTVSVRANEELEVYAGPEVSQGDFRRMCAEAAKSALDDEKKKVTLSFEKKLDSIKDRLMREERELDEDETELSQRKMEEVGKHAENLISLLAGRKRSISTSLTKRRMTSQAKADVQESLETIEQYKKEIEDVERDRLQALADVDEKWQEILERSTEIPVTPYKKDILVELFGVSWLPFYVYQDGGKEVELAAYA